jgi:hypothetical protein
MGNTFINILLFLRLQIRLVALQCISSLRQNSRIESGYLFSGQALEAMPDGINESVGTVDGVISVVPSPNNRIL